MLISLSLLATAVFLIGALALYYKFRIVHLQVYELQSQLSRELMNHFAQLEALISLYHDLKPTKSFPATRGWAGSPDFLLHISKYVEQQRPKCIVECSSGVSSLVLARAVQLAGIGHVYSLEHDPAFAARTEAELKRHELENFATIIVAPLVQHEIQGKPWLWYDLTNFTPQNIELLVIDGPPYDVQAQARFPALPLLFKRMSTNSAIFLDDASRADEAMIVREWIRDYPYVERQLALAEKGVAVLVHK